MNTLTQEEFLQYLEIVLKLAKELLDIGSSFIDKTEDQQVILERSQMIFDEFHRIKSTLQRTLNGDSFEEAYDEEILLEMAERKKSCETYLAHLMEHIMRLKYCMSNQNHNHWRVEINNFRNQIIDICNYNSPYEDKNIIRELERNLERYYEQANKFYDKELDDYGMKKARLNYIPKKIPHWTLNDLLNQKIDKLLDFLPDPNYDDIINGTLMQTHPQCLYLNQDHLDERIECKSCKAICSENQINYCTVLYYSK